MNKQNEQGNEWANTTAYHQSRYIADLNTHFDVNGLIFPYTDEFGYEFDFYAPKGDRLIKVFTETNDEAIKKYAGHPRLGQIQFIIETDRIEKAEHILVVVREKDLSKPIHRAALTLNAALIHNGSVYFPVRRRDGGVCWQLAPEPYVIGYEQGKQDGYSQCLADIEAEKEKENVNARLQH